MLINTDFVNYLSSMSKKFSFKLVQISTDHVYKGRKMIRNSENDETFTVNNYAKSKLLAEKYLFKLKII